MTANAIRTTLRRVVLPRRSEFLVGWFRWWVRGYLKKHFHAVRLSRCNRPRVSPDVPLLVVLNHPSWWDPLVCLVIAETLFPKHAHFAPIDASALARYSLFGKLGFYAVEQGTRRGASAFLHTSTAILSQPSSAVWITAQGQFTDPRVRPAGLRPGVGHVARRLARGVILPLALEYPFWEERLPEALARFGEPIPIENGQELGPAEWVERIEASLTAAQDSLHADSVKRNRSAFEALIAGNVAIGGIYDRWRRLHAWLVGKRFQAEHGSEGERT
jgi:1-acyl-sn-glycerol-3-phosphate acyltransferase